MPMAANPPSDPKSAGDDRNLVAAEATPGIPFEARLQLFWSKYRGVVLGVCALVLLAIIGKGVWDYLARQRELEVQAAYARTTNAEQLRSFAAAHPDHALAGVAHVRLADEAYTAGNFADAAAAYEKAMGILGEGPLAARSRLGRAMAQLQAGNTAEATEALRQLANDADQFKVIRAEAAYHLASLAAEAGNAEEVQKLSDQLMQIDPSSPWTQRGLSLRTTMPVTAEPAATNPSGDAPAATPEVQVTVPKK